MPSTLISVRAGEDLLADIDANGFRESDGTINRAATIRRDLERYYGLLDRERAHLRELLTDEECAALVLLLRGSFLDLNLADGLALEVRDALSELGAVGPVLLKRILGLGPTARLALVEAVERFRERRKGGTADARELLR